jgi:hypothetical protein
MALLVLTSSYRSTEQIREESNQVRDQAQQLRGKPSTSGRRDVHTAGDDD